MIRRVGFAVLQVCDGYLSIKISYLPLTGHQDVVFAKRKSEQTRRRHTKFENGYGFC